MNILITTFSLLFVLSLGASFFWSEAKSCGEKIAASRGFFEAARLADNKQEQKRFEKWPDLNKSPSKKTKATRGLRTKTFVSHRTRTPPMEQGRLHITPLWNQESSSFVQNLLKQLLKELYGHTLWFKEDKIDLLIKALTAFGKEKKESFSHSVFLNELDADQYLFWYQMVKGTQTYDIEKHVGYPPIDDFIDFSPSTSKRLCHFPFATIPLLQAFFGTKLTEEILAIEKEKWSKDHIRHYCLKKELLPLIPTTTHGGELVKTIENFCYFNQSVGRRSFVQGTENKSGISIRNTLEEKEISKSDETVK